MDEIQAKVIPSVGQALDRIGLIYMQFLNSHNKAERVTLLSDLHKASIDAQRLSKQVIELFGQKVIDGPMPSVNPRFALRVGEAIGGSLHGAVLNLDQLYRNFVMPATSEQNDKKIQLLYQMHIVCKDLAELALITSAEPEKNLVEIN